jgi:hypothetical protein
MVMYATVAVAGAIMIGAITAQNSNVAQTHGFRRSPVGVIVLIAGAVGFVVSGSVCAISNKSLSVFTRVLDRTNKNETCATTQLHEEQYSL